MLINRNITVGTHRTSVRLEPEFWAGLADIAEHDGITIDRLCTDIDRGAGELSRTAAIRVFVTGFYARMRVRGAAQPTLAATRVGADQRDDVVPMPTRLVG